MALGEQTGPGWLFCPADRPERFEKAAAAADVVILDLEDGVAAKDREAAREALIDTPLDPDRTVVRDQPDATADHDSTWRRSTRTEYTDGDAGEDRIRRAGRDLAPLDVIVLVETPLGALAVERVGAHGQRVRRRCGAPRTCSPSRAAPPTGGPTAATATSPSTCGRRACWPPRRTGRMALDSVYLDIKDLDGLRRRDRRRRRRRLRRQGRHPSRRRWRSSAPATRRRADRSNGRDTCSTAARDERGVFQFEGIMVDAPVLRRAERIVQLAPHPGS